MIIEPDACVRGELVRCHLISHITDVLCSQKVKIALKVGAEYNVPKAPVPAEEEGKKKEGAGGETGAILKSLEDEKEKAFYDRQATRYANTSFYSLFTMWFVCYKDGGRKDRLRSSMHWRRRLMHAFVMSML